VEVRSTATPIVVNLPDDYCPRDAGQAAASSAA
jgi:hypothetical protein